MLCKDEGYCYRCSAVCVSLCISRGRSISHLGRGTFRRTCTDPLSEELQRNAECNEYKVLTVTKVIAAAAIRPIAIITCQFVYWHCPRNKRSWVYVTVWRPSVRPSVCLSRYSTATEALALSSNGAAARRSAANAGSVVLTAELTRLNTGLF